MNRINYSSLLEEEGEITFSNNNINNNSNISNANSNNTNLLGKKRKNKKKKQKGDNISATTNAKQLLEENGTIYVYSFKLNNEHDADESDRRIYICRIKEVNFVVNEELFKNGRKSENIENLSMMETTPNINFWHQRYYFYSRFDEGIKMDYESILYFNIRLVLSDTGGDFNIHS
jgi:hypothetical protein